MTCVCAFTSHWPLYWTQFTIAPPPHLTSPCLHCMIFPSCFCSYLCKPPLPFPSLFLALFLCLFCAFWKWGFDTQHVTSISMAVEEQPPFFIHTLLFYAFVVCLIFCSYSLCTMTLFIVSFVTIAMGLEFLILKIWTFERYPLILMSFCYGSLFFFQDSINFEAFCFSESSSRSIWAWWLAPH